MCMCVCVCVCVCVCAHAGVFTPHKPCTPEVSSAAIELLSLATSYPLDTLHSDSDEGQHTGGGEDPLWGDDEQHGNTE